jgi:hypothetical protein
MKRSILTTVLVLSAFGNLAFNFWSLVADERHFRQDVVRHTALRLQAEFQTLVQEAPALSEAALASKLGELRDRERISFYGFSLPGRSPASVNVGSDFEPVLDAKVRTVLDPQNKTPVGVYIGQNLNGHDVFIGQAIDKDFIEKAANYNRANFWSLVLGNFLIVAVVMMYGLQDILRLFGRLKKGGVTSFSQWTGGFNHRESSAMAQALGHSARAQLKARTQIEEMKSLVLPSLLHEAETGQTLPYEFQAVLMRFDINNSTAVYANPEWREIQDHWFEAFKIGSAQIATRYGGIAHEEIGDQIILYFKENLGPHFADLAVAAARDISQLAKSIQLEIYRKYSYQFTVKGSLDLGRLKAFRSSFDSGNSGNRGRIKVTGASSDSADNIFVTTDRILKRAVDKSRNTILCSANIPFRSSGLVIQFDRLEPSQGPGYTGELFMLSEFSKFSVTREVPRALLYADDQSLIMVLNHLEALSLQPAQDAMSVAWVSLLRGRIIANPGAELQLRWLRLLKHFVSLPELPDSDRTIVPSLVAMTPAVMNSLPADHSSRRELEAILTDLMTHPNRRVQANAVEAWSAMNMERDLLRKKMKFFKHNRSMANALIEVLTQAIDVDQMGRLGKMLRSEDPAMRAAGCFAFGKIYAFYLNADPVVIESNPEFANFLAMVRVLQGDASEMVKRQARRAVGWAEAGAGLRAG